MTTVRTGSTPAGDDSAERLAFADTSDMTRRIVLGGCQVDLMTQGDALDLVITRAAGARGRPLAVVSANLDHVHHFGRGGRWQGVVRQSASAGSLEWLTLLDGAPLVARAEQLTGRAWPRLAGSDLIYPILDAATERGLKVGFLGGAESTHRSLQRVLEVSRPRLCVAGWWAPPAEVVADSDASRRLASEIEACGVDLLVVGLGKPKQELWIAEHGASTGAPVLLAFGAVVDFLAHRVPRAPEWMSRTGLEWLYRLSREPRRLARRYLIDGPVAYHHLRRYSAAVTAADAPAQRLVDADDAPSSSVATTTDITVVVVTYNNEREIGAALADVRREAGDLRLRIVVVDNASTDGTVDDLALDGDVTLVRSTRNLGYAGGINAARDYLGDSRATLILNPDVRLQPGAIVQLWQRVWAPGVGAAVPRLVDPDGSTYPSLRFEPSVIRNVGDALFGGHARGRPSWLTQMDFGTESYRHAHAVDWATGACLLVRREVDAVVGPWDERFFLYYEETDYLRRLREIGWSVWYEPSAIVEHARGASGRSPELAALMAVNGVRYARKHAGAAKARATRVAGLLRAILRLGDPGQRRAAYYLLHRDRWAALPKSTPAAARARRPKAITGSVVVPAHNEAAVIGDTLAPLAPLIQEGVFQLVVAANGCTDGTVAVAAQVEGATVLDLPEASKTKALNAADAVCETWPRMYLDADVAIEPAAIQDVFATLNDRSVMAARPSYRYDASGASWLVRSYYRARSSLSAADTSLWGAGAFALSEEGRSRFDAFPEVTSDDLFVDSLFSPHEKAVVCTESVVVRTPRNVSALLAVLRRTYLGNREFAASTYPRTSSTGGSVRDIAGSIRSPRSALDAGVYAAFATIGRFRARRRGARWDRDESSRIHPRDEAHR